MHKTNRIVPAVVLGIAGIFIAASPSFGALITYTMEATASGSLGGTAHYPPHRRRGPEKPTSRYPDRLS